MTTLLRGLRVGMKLSSMQPQSVNDLEPIQIDDDDVDEIEEVIAGPKRKLTSVVGMNSRE
jgi:hypothetical protein